MVGVAEVFLNKWHDFIASQNMDILDALLHEKVVFYSPIVHTPQKGKEITKLYLTAATQVLKNDFKYRNQLVDFSNISLEFTCKIGEIIVNGIDLITLDKEGKVIEFKVFVRPLKGVNAVHEAMMAMLASSSDIRSSDIPV